MAEAVVSDRCRVDALLAGPVFTAAASRVLDGQCVLFLGAGASTDSGGPTGQELADEIRQKFLASHPVKYELRTAAAYAEDRAGRKNLVDFIVDRLKQLRPIQSLVDLISLPWSAIFSVNFDDLVEQAAAKVDANRLHVVVDPKELECKPPDRVPLCMIHGSIHHATDPDHGLVLTWDDYRRTAKVRKALYSSLAAHLEQREFFYIGFGMNDLDFRDVFGDLRDSYGPKSEQLPRGYCIAPDPDPFKKQHWETRKVTLVDATLADFVAAVDGVRRERTKAPIADTEQVALLSGVAGALRESQAFTDLDALDHIIATGEGHAHEN